MEEDRGYLHSNGSSIHNQSILHRFPSSIFSFPMTPDVEISVNTSYHTSTLSHMFAFRCQRGRIQYLPTTGFKSDNPQ
ncbi:Protein of unknown function [Pyronema omphalodes CBS 100304]|uniref:Uncharacterized protein n=1 Tax=Pyronema omphalodes (strain CBS 100304) TaxID=1076935 RepID=U4L0M1_PYROM|nr:Protein of unknown function [Pyronema omphalodes CBS 100304]